MALRRRKKQSDEAQDEQVTEVQPVEGVRHLGPWDSSERSPGDDPAYVDLGALQVKVRLGLNLEMPVDESDEIGSVVFVTDDSALELRAFAANKSGGLWDEVRDDLILEVERLNGQCEQVDGPFGPELHVRVPVQVEGEEGFQPSRIIGIEGPRWLLRATFLGDAGLNPKDDGLLMDALRDVIVVRGSEPKLLREALLLTPPSSDTVVLDDE
ncbi:DUF3710 domain-containing protein [Aeromicrobium chenweiae]|uniref:DUF3710 domain-containing protein n=1 Tax=Aeromicrobium chenweiae TaxID=2079793 RepID=A0A2S0WL53_9ACTN|nr:DUF3710 domain-containing protein [Aeromicrobium chenweiae]AWB92078.1 DUF3710 domain-containing protein [Aeromicrobium chenweiae]TGN32927.1 DUF3710 domain-containing protein [Aeromicrobium chenweiae]